MPPRPLTFPLTDTASLTAITDSDATFNPLPSFPSDPDEKTFVLLHVSANEFKKLASAIDIGMDIGYPDESVAIWYMWVRGVMSQSACEIITNCINTSDGTREAIANLVTSSEVVDRIIEQAKELGLIPVEPTVPVTDCRDNVFSACVQYVEYMNTSIVDFFDRLETSQFEQFFEVVSALDLDVGLVFGFVNWLTEQARDGYNASYTQEIATQIACDLFCEMRDDCGFTIEKAYAVHQQAISEYVSLDVFQQANVFDLLSAFLGVSSLPAGLWVHSLFMIQLNAVLLFESQFSSLGLATVSMSQFKKRVQSWINDTDPDWNFLCDCPVPFQAFINTNTPTILLNGVEVSGTLEGEGWRYNVTDFDNVIVNGTGQLGIRFNTNGGIYNPSDPLARIDIIQNGGGMAVYNRSGNIGNSNGLYNAGFVNADNNIAFVVIDGSV